jgi:hypothetical protein
MAQEITDDKVYEVNEDIVSRDNQDGTVVLMKMDESEIFYKIDGVAAAIWKEIKSGKAVGNIKTDIMGQYDVTGEQLNSDLNTFVTELIAKNILK